MNNPTPAALRATKSITEKWSVGLFCGSDWAAATEEQVAATIDAETTLPELIAALEAIIDRWDTPVWKNAPATGEVINAARIVLNKAKGTP